MSEVLSPFWLEGQLFEIGDNFIIPDSFYARSDLTPEKRDRILGQIFGDGWIDDLPPELLETEAAREDLFNNPKWAKTGHCGKCIKRS